MNRLWNSDQGLRGSDTLLLVRWTAPSCKCPPSLMFACKSEALFPCDPFLSHLTVRYDPVTVTVLPVSPARLTLLRVLSWVALTCETCEIPLFLWGWDKECVLKITRKRKEVLWVWWVVALLFIFRSSAVMQLFIYFSAWSPLTDLKCSSLQTNVLLSLQILVNGDQVWMEQPLWS